jgi:tetratricopeptide (TPR) repeat protein
MDDFMNTLLILTLIGGATSLIWRIYKKHKNPKPLKTFKDFQDKATQFLINKEYDSAIEMKLKALELQGITCLQRGDLLYGIGGIYLEVDDFEMATYYFDQTFQVVAEEKIPFDKRYNEVLDAYVKANRRADAANLLEDLLKRQSYDKRFKKLEKYRLNR